MYNSSPADCNNALAVTSMTDYDGKPGGLSTPADMTNGDDTYTDFSNYAQAYSAGRVVAAPGARGDVGCAVDSITAAGAPRLDAGLLANRRLNARLHVRAISSSHIHPLSLLQTKSQRPPGAVHLVPARLRPLRH